MTTYSAKIIADSITEYGHRLTTMEVVFPRFILPEINTHKVMCLSGDTVVSFDLPHGVASSSPSHRGITLAELYRKWHTGTKPRRNPRRKTLDLSKIEDSAVYTPKMLEELTNTGYTWFNAMYRLSGLPRHSDSPVLYLGADLKNWAASYYGEGATNVCNLRPRIEKMHSRCLNEDTGEFQHSNISNVFYSGKKELFEVEFSNGKKIKSTKEHRFFTDKGWLTLEEATGLSLFGNNEVSWLADTPRFASNGDVAESKESFLRLVEEGYTRKEIAELWNVKKKRVDRLAKSWGLTKPRPERPELLDDVEWLQKQRDAGQSAQMVADSLGCSLDMVKHSFIRNKIKNSNPALTHKNSHTKEPWNKGRKYSNIKTRGVPSKAKVRKGSDSHLWRGGTSTERSKIGRWTQKEAFRVHQSYGFKCQMCNHRTDFDAHHIVPVYKDESLAYEFDNLITLCESCHLHVHKNHLEDVFIETFENGEDLGNIRSLGKHPFPGDKPKPPAGRKLVRRWVDVINIKYVGVEDTYDLEVAGPYHNFVANGMVVHNSKSSASSRARPSKKVIADVRANPFIPEEWGANRPGMQATEMLGEVEQRIARGVWVQSLNRALVTANELAELGVHKQLVNRVLEPYMWHTSLITGTEWSNFFALRDHEDAQPEMRETARAMKAAYNNSTPEFKEVGEFHVPYTSDDEEFETLWQRALASAARCARVSYLNHDGSKPDIEKDLTLFDKLRKSGHMSPMEHVAIANYGVKTGLQARSLESNLKGWTQLRKMYPNEDNYAKMLESTNEV